MREKRVGTGKISVCFSTQFRVAVSHFSDVPINSIRMLDMEK